MNENGVRERARRPEDLNRLVLERLNAGDVDGLVALYERRAVLALPGGGAAVGHDAIRRVYEGIVEGSPTFEPGDTRPAVVSGNLALTTVVLADGGVTAEVARRQPDGTWLWTIDQPRIGA